MKWGKEVGRRINKEKLHMKITEGNITLYANLQNKKDTNKCAPQEITGKVFKAGEAAQE